MNLSEIMQNADLSIYPKVGLVIFTGIFALVCYRTLRMKRHTDVDRLAHMALDDAPVVIPNNDNTGGAA